jgi:hypothetical protein
MTEAVRALLGYAFLDLDMHRIRATVVTANVASAQLLEGLSFQKEGLLRDAQFVNGKFDSLFSYALLQSEWVT